MTFKALLTAFSVKDLENDNNLSGWAGCVTVSMCGSVVCALIGSITLVTEAELI
jgi:hypothetical protein